MENLSLEAALTDIASSALDESLGEYRAKCFRLYDAEEKEGKPVYIRPEFVADHMLYDAFYKNFMHRIRDDDRYKTVSSDRINKVMDDFSDILGRCQGFNGLKGMPPNFDVKHCVKEVLVAALINNSENESFKISGLPHILVAYDYLKTSKTVEFTKRDGKIVTYKHGCVYFGSAAGR